MYEQKRGIFLRLKWKWNKNYLNDQTIVFYFSHNEFHLHKNRHYNRTEAKNKSISYFFCRFLCKI